jgi:hypothetical protein
VGEDLHEYSSNNKSLKGKTTVTAVKVNNTPPVQKKEVVKPAVAEKVESPANRASTITNGSSTKGDANPFDEEEWDESDALVDNGEPGVPVKALYDYEGAENDELSFKTGDVFEKLEDEDEQGWCKGRKDGRVGLYPANYVEVVPH